MINSVSSNSYRKKKSKTNQKSKPQPEKATSEENRPCYNIVTSNFKNSSLKPSPPMHSNTEWSGTYVFKLEKKNLNAMAWNGGLLSAFQLSWQHQYSLQRQFFLAIAKKKAIAPIEAIFFLKSNTMKARKLFPHTWNLPKSQSHFAVLTYRSINIFQQHSKKNKPKCNDKLIKS